MLFGWYVGLSTMIKTRLECEGVTFSYGRGDHKVLHGVDLTLQPSCCLGLIGPNGAGKSTLLRIAAGLAKPDEGTVRVDGVHMFQLSPRERGRVVAYVPQTFSLPFTFSVLEVVLQGRHPHMNGATFESRHDLEIARSAMEQTGVGLLGERTFDALSGGERQRVLIAAALAQEPRLLILDEPTSSLDLRFQSAVVGLVRELVESTDLSVLVALHDLNLASSMCDDLALLVDGELYASGTPAEVVTRQTLESAYSTELHVGQGPQGPFVLPLISARRATSRR